MLPRLLKKAVVFDAFPKVDSGYQNRTTRGGLLTVIVTAALCLLALAEFREYLKTFQRYEFLVDRSIYHTLELNLDITINMPCKYLTVDVLDTAGERIHVSELIQTRPVRFEVRSAQGLSVRKSDDALAIYQLIQAASLKSGWLSNDPVDKQASACRVFGSFQVNKVSGNLHITCLGHGYASSVHTDHEVMNFTHRIDKFSFGQHYPRLINPLDNSIEVTHSHFENYRYFMSVVPTTYVDSHGHVLLTNQYSVTDFRRVFDIEKGEWGLPGIFFTYDLEPISIRITETHQPLTWFLVRLCGIIGGTWATAGFAFKVFDNAWAVLTGGRENMRTSVGSASNGDMHINVGGATGYGDSAAFVGSGKAL